MIRLTRPPKPDVLVKNASQWTTAFVNAQTETEKKKHRKKYNHKSVRDALESMCAGKCAYCESYIKHIDTPQIEHYCPVSVCPNRVFEWENLLLACGVCNGSQYKSDKFPSESEGGLLLDPSTDDPDQHLTFDFDTTTMIASVYGKTERGRTTVETLGLNRSELRAYRSTYIKKMLALKRLASTNPEAQKLVEEAKKSREEYSAFVKSLP